MRGEAPWGWRSHEPVLWESPGDWGKLAFRTPEKEVILILDLSPHHDMTKPLQAVLSPERLMESFGGASETL